MVARLTITAEQREGGGGSGQGVAYSEERTTIALSAEHAGRILHLSFAAGKPTRELQIAPWPAHGRLEGAQLAGVPDDGVIALKTVDANGLRVRLSDAAVAKLRTDGGTLILIDVYR